METGNDRKPLFDGKTLKGWRGFKKEDVGSGWIVRDGCLMTLGKGDDMSGDIITTGEYEDFDLYLEWAISPGGNSGIMFHVIEDGYPTTYATGPEYQIIDDEGYPQKLEDWQKTGANYAMNNPEPKKLKPVGEFNSSRIVVKDGHVQHYLNGDLIVEYDLWSADWKKRVAEGKWKDYLDYGLARKGHIALQDHGSVVKFRNISIKDLTNPGISIFNGKNLNGWKTYGTEQWYVNNKDLVCESGPDKQYGYLVLTQDFRNFILHLEFKQEKNGNSGVFFRSAIEGTDIKGWQVEIAPAGKNTGGIYETGGRGWLYEIPEEKENILKEGEWNSLVIKVKDDRVMTWLNNRMMVDLRDDKIGVANGIIALQIHDKGDVKIRWRNLFLREL